MDQATALNVAQQYANIVKANMHSDKIILFGSYSKGNFNEESDIDIAVIFNDYKNAMDIQMELMRLRRKVDSRIEPHPFRKSEFEISNPIVNEIIKFGKEIN